MSHRRPDREASGPTAVICSVAEARRFVADPPDAAAILTLTPMVRAALDDKARALCLDDPVTDWGHARIAARGLHASDQFLAALDSTASVRPGTRHALGFSVRIHGYLMGRIWQILGAGGPWLLPDRKRWKPVADREEACRILFDHLRPRTKAGQPPPFAALYRWLRRLTLSALRRRGPWLVSRSKRLVFGLDEALTAEVPALRHVLLSSSSAGWSEYLNLARAWRRGLNGAQLVELSAATSLRDEARAAVDHALAQIKEPVFRAGLSQEFKEELASLAAECEGLYADVVDIAEALRPSFYATRQDSGLFAVVSDAMGAAGVSRYVINYNSFFVSDQAISDSLTRFFIDARMPSGLSDHYVMWSPVLAAASRRVLAPDSAEAMEPLRLAPPDPAELKRRPGPRRILHASNYTEFNYFFPWFMETSNEFVDDIVALAEAVTRLNDVELTVRTKPKGECVPDTIRFFIPENIDCRVTDNTQPFQEALDDADLLVAFVSTTVEEAVLRRKPVLLWGPTERHRHFPARTTPPTAEDRAAVYAVAGADDLPAMIAAILDAHTGRPLSDEETAGYVWPAGTQDVRELARAIIRRDVQPQLTEISN